GRTGDQARDREQYADQNDQRDGPDLPAREIEHRSSGLVVCRLGVLGKHLAERALDDADADALCDLHFQLIVADLGDLSASTAASDDLIALLDRIDRQLVVFRALLLRTD